MLAFEREISFFAAPEPEALLGAAEQIAAEIDLDLAWEFAPETEFGFADLARDYFEVGAGRGGPPYADGGVAADNVSDQWSGFVSSGVLPPS